MCAQLFMICMVASCVTSVKKEFDSLPVAFLFFVISANCLKMDTLVFLDGVASKAADLQAKLFKVEP